MNNLPPELFHLIAEYIESPLTYREFKLVCRKSLGLPIKSPLTPRNLIRQPDLLRYPQYLKLLHDLDNLELYSKLVDDAINHDLDDNSTWLLENIPELHHYISWRECDD